MLPTGPGAWEKKAVQAKKGVLKDKSKNKVAMQKAVPSKTHMAIKTLIDRQLMHRLVS